MLGIASTFEKPQFGQVMRASVATSTMEAG
jgi:hypothetical protein